MEGLTWQMYVDRKGRRQNGWKEESTEMVDFLYAENEDGR